MPKSAVSSVDMSQKIAEALQQDTAGLSGPANILARATGASVRMAKNWLSGRNVPSNLEYVARLCAGSPRFKQLLMSRISEAEREAEIKKIAAVRARNACMREKYEGENDADSVGNWPDGVANGPYVEAHFGLGVYQGRMVVQPSASGV